MVFIPDGLCVQLKIRGNPLQYSCLENPMDRGAWWSTVHGVAKSRTRLSDLTNYFYKRHWCRQTSLPYITHAYKTRGSVPSRTPHTCTSHHTHAFWTQSLSHPRSIMKLKTSGSEAGDSGVGWRMERKYLDGICETNWDREINTPIWLEKQKSLN